MKKFKSLLITLFILFPLISYSSVALKPGSPSRYVVKQGDTVWVIANMYLQHPWEWNKLWHANPRISNPDVIYPGSLLVLTSYKHRPSLEMVHNGPYQAPVTRTYRRKLVKGPIPTIPLRLIKPFLDKSQVFDTDVLAPAPYVVAYQGDHIIAGYGDTIFVKGLLGTPYTLFTIYRPNGYYRDPVTNKMLGFQADHIGDGRIVAPTLPATFRVSHSNQNVNIGDRVLPAPPQHYNYSFVLKAPSHPVYGQIISLINALDQVARNQIVVINQGIFNGVVAGDMLGIFHRGDLIQDPLYIANSILLPSERIGELMIFHSFSFVSYGLVMRSTQPIHMFDLVQNP